MRERVRYVNTTLRIRYTLEFPLGSVGFYTMD